MGTVRPANEVTIQPQVQGKVVSLGKALIPGGYVKKGGSLVRIEGNDYQLAVRQYEGQLATAKAQLAQEKGRQAIAAKEYELMKKEIEEAGGNLELILRKPQLDAAQAAVENAKAALAKARLDLGRTRINAPFNAIVESRNINIGTHVTPSTPLAKLVGTDVYWIETLVPVDHLRWVSIPQEGKTGTPGSEVTVHDPAAWGESMHRKGRVLRLLPGLEEKGRMARVLVEVKDPLALEEENKGKPRLLVGSYVSVEIDGGVLESAPALERQYLRDNDTVWVMDENGSLDIRKVDVAFRDRDRVYVAEGLNENDAVVTTNLSGPVQGMPLRTAGEEAGGKKARRAEAGRDVKTETDTEAAAGTLKKKRGGKTSGRGAGNAR